MPRSARLRHRPVRDSGALCRRDAGGSRDMLRPRLFQRRAVPACFNLALDVLSIPLDNVTSCESTKPSCIGCARYGKRYESSMFAVYSVGTCIDEDSGAHHRGRQRRVSSAERTRAAGAPIPFRASWLKAGRGKRGRFSRPWRQPSVIGANEAGGSRRCASVNQGGTARAFSRPWTG